MSSFAATPRPAWAEKPRKVTSFGKSLFLVLSVLGVLVPFWAVVATSLSPDAQVIRNGGWSFWPQHFTLHAYRELFSTGVIGHAIWLSALVTVVGTALSLLGTATLAYSLSRPGVFAGKPVLLIVLFTFLFPVGIIPSFLLVNSMHLRNQLWALILPTMLSVFNVVVMRGFFQGIPQELFEAARIDGAGELRILFRIVLPLSKAVMAVVGLFYAVGYWNNYFNAMLYIDSSSDWPLQPILRQMVIAGGSLDPDGTSTTTAPQTMLTALVVMAVVPIAVAFPFLQRFFTKGVLTGAVKS